ncbi:TlpA family protein disulfide reductase [Bogoriella caseilytica]|uniref:Peroxiredoxin n=1 Tax=Bogoriella caseilytica TaxID=56055 RepID=A0A3N2BAN3_9MICO|nr:TlpA disulfide reductase family protein [Bogoriella caseilytica]ROR72336.1 peroxiredoxin [Bogoriella caseilytica]
MKPGLVLVALLALVLTACAPPGSSQDGVIRTNPGYEAGDGSFSVWEADERDEPVEHVGTTYEGEEIDLAELRGDVVVLNFWYAACPPCRAEAPDLAAFHEDYSGNGVHLLGVNPRDDAGAAQAFERTFGIPYPSFHDAQARGVAALEGKVPLQAMPVTVVLDHEGRVAARILGQAEPVILRGLVDDVLAEQA